MLPLFNLLVLLCATIDDIHEINQLDAYLFYSE